MRVQHLGLGVVTQRLAVGLQHASAGGLDDRLGGGRIPLAGRTEARIEIRAAFRDQAELDRAADRHKLIGLEPRQIAIEHGVPM